MQEERSEAYLDESYVSRCSQGFSAVRRDFPSHCLQPLSCLFPHALAGGRFRFQLAWKQNRSPRYHSQLHGIPAARQPGNRDGLPATQRAGFVERAVRDIDIFEAKSVPPQTTRAKLRGEFIRRAQEKRRDFTVDWVHLKLNDQAQRTVLCKDPFRSVDERVEKLIAGM